MKPVQAGELRHRIQILREVATGDGDGYAIVRRDTVMHCWAKVSRTSGTEMAKAGADFGQDKARFLIRWVGPHVIDRKMLVRWEGRDYRIEYVNDYAGRQYLEIWGVWESKEAGA